MRLISLFFSLLLTASSILAQSEIPEYPTSTPKAQNDHVSFPPSNEAYKSTKEWKTYKALNISGWCALAAGATTTLCGVYGIALGTGHEAGDPDPMFITITSVGGAITLSSIPLLIIAHKYKKKAKMKNLSVDLTNIYTRDCIGRYSYTPAFNLSYSF